MLNILTCGTFVGFLDISAWGLHPLLVAPRAFFSSLLPSFPHQINLLPAFATFPHQLLPASFVSFLSSSFLCSVCSSITCCFCCFLLYFSVAEVFHFVFATRGFAFVSCCLSFPFCVSLLLSCILLRVFHFLFLPFDFFRHTRANKMVFQNHWWIKRNS